MVKQKVIGYVKINFFLIFLSLSILPFLACITVVILDIYIIFIFLEPVIYHSGNIGVSSDLNLLVHYSFLIVARHFVLSDAGVFSSIFLVLLVFISLIT